MPYAGNSLPRELENPEVRDRSVAAQIGEINEANSVDLVLLNPLEYRTEVCSAPASWLQMNWQFGIKSVLSHWYRPLNVPAFKTAQVCRGRLFRQRDEIVGSDLLVYT